MKIRFKVHHRPKGDAADIPTYKAGETHDLELSYAQKYIRLGYAEAAVDEPAPVVEPVVVEELRAAYDAIVSLEAQPVVASAPVAPPREFRPGKYRK